MEIMACDAAFTHTHTHNARAHAQMLGENYILRNTVQHKCFIMKTARLVVFMELLHISASDKQTKQNNISCACY